MRIFAPRRPYAPTDSATSSDLIPGPVAVAVALARGAWWLAGNVLAPVALVAAVLAWRWLTGAPMRPGRPARRYVTRPVRATAQTSLTGAAVCAAVWPVATVTTLAGLALVVVAVAGYTRAHARRLARPRRVRAYVHRPAEVDQGAAALATLDAREVEPGVWLGRLSTGQPVLIRRPGGAR